MARTTAYGHIGIVFALGGVISAVSATPSAVPLAGLMWFIGLACTIWELASSPAQT